MLRLAWYVARLRSGAMNPVTAPETVSAVRAVTVLDGHDGIGQVVTDRAISAAAAPHAFTASGWSPSATVTTSAPPPIGHVARRGRLCRDPDHQRQPGHGALGWKRQDDRRQPWSIAVPSGHGAVVLDIANTGVARGKVYAARERGQRLPEGWAIDADGLPTTDPQAAIDGIILPMAGHKGYAISFMMDVLSGVLTGSAYSTGVIGPYVPDQRSGCGHLVIAIAIEAILAPAEFESRMDDLIDIVKRSATIRGGEILVPGELENRAIERAGGMVNLPEQTLITLAGLARDAGVATLS